jgi:hypothetical protein
LICLPLSIKIRRDVTGAYLCANSLYAYQWTVIELSPAIHQDKT